MRAEAISWRGERFTVGSRVKFRDGGLGLRGEVVEVLGPALVRVHWGRTALGPDRYADEGCGGLEVCPHDGAGGGDASPDEARKVLAALHQATAAELPPLAEVPFSLAAPVSKARGAQRSLF